jgi:outer membrane immunogenic protein
MQKLLSHAAILTGTCFVLLAPATADGVYRGSSYTTPLSWTGFYIGAIAGGAWSRSDASTVVTTPGSNYFNGSDVSQIDSAGATQRQTGTDFTGGFEAGVNFQIGNWVWGVEADASSMRVRDSESATASYLSSPTHSFTASSETDANWLVTLRPRLGFAVNNLLFYGTGGLALSDVKHRFEFSDTFASAAESASASTTVGWTVGGGMEFMMCRNWTMKAEYLYVDFGKDSAAGVVVNTVSPQISFPTLAHEADLTTQIARAGINYKF